MTIAELSPALTLIVGALLIPLLRGRRGFATTRPGFQALRGVLLLVTSAFSFVALQYMPVAEFTAVMLLGPVFVTVLAALGLLILAVSPARTDESLSKVVEQVNQKLVKLFGAGGFRGRRVVSIRQGALGLLDLTPRTALGRFVHFRGWRECRFHLHNVPPLRRRR